MQTETLIAGDWWARPRGTDAPAWIAQYQQSVSHRHRTAIVEQVQALGAETLLEVGCHCGPNLMRLAKDCPTLQMLGVDVNAEAVRAGQQWMRTAGLSERVKLSVGRMPEALMGLPTGSVDVVLSCYALAYIAPGDIDAVLYEMGRIAAKAVVLAEPIPGPGQALEKRALTGYSEWVHDYSTATQWIATWRGMRLSTTPVTPPVDRLNAVLVAHRDGR